MTTIKRIQVSLTGGTMGAGVATMFWGSTDTGFQPAVKTLWQSCASLMAGYVTLSIPNQGEEFLALVRDGEGHVASHQARTALP